MTPHSPRATARLNAGTAAFRAGDYPRARREFERALALARAQLGPDHPQTLRTLSDLGAACAALGDHEASRAAHEAALAGRRRIIGGAHHDVGVSLHNLGAAYAAQFRAVFTKLGARPGILFDPFFLQGVAGNPALNQDDHMHPNAAGVAIEVARIKPLVEKLLDRKK